MRGSGYIPLDPFEIEQARQMDIMTYMRMFEPENLVHVQGGIYCTREHDSLKISNGKWFWWSRGFGGVTALDYLLKVKGVRFADAVNLINGRSGSWIPPPKYAGQNKIKKLLLPPKHSSSRRAERYLAGRGIDREIINRCVNDGIIYESEDYHSVVFIGKDESGKPRYAACRSIGNGFRGDAYGSDKGYSFRLTAKEKTDCVHIFEAAIDLLSYATYLKLTGRDYERENLLSLSGVYQPKKEVEESKIPVAVSGFLKKNPDIRKIILHLDNDNAGRLAAQTLEVLLKKKGYDVRNRPPPAGKDVNDFLMLYLGKGSRQQGKAADLCR